MWPSFVGRTRTPDHETQTARCTSGHTASPGGRRGHQASGQLPEIGDEKGSGKTTICLHLLAEAQKTGGVAAFIDTEHALDIAYAKKLGVDVNNLLLSQPEFGEQALEIVETLVRSGALDIIIIDSVAALTPRAEIEGEMGDPSMGVQARLMSQALRKLTSAIHRSHTSVIFINQLREKVGVFFGNPEVTPGGRALKFYSSVRIDLRRAETIKKGDVAIGSHVKAKVVKNKVAPPFKTAEFDILFDEGISSEGCILDLGVTLGLVSKSGAFYTYNDSRIGQGRENAREYLKEHKEIAKEIEQQIRAQAFNIPVPADNNAVE
jgi:recombination protein RecA